MEGFEEFNEDAAMARYKAGTKMGFNQDSNEPPELRFVDGVSPLFMQIQGNSYTPHSQTTVGSGWNEKRMGK